MQIEFERQRDHYKRFVGVSVEKFLRTEMERLSQKLPAKQQPRRSNQKEPSNEALLFRGFVNGVLSVTEKLLQTFDFDGCCFSIARNIYEFFHLEEKMRPLMRLNEPYEVKQALLKMFTYAYAWSCWRIGRGNTDSAQQRQFRAKLERRIERIVNGLKIHEDIISIDVSDLRINKFEDELLIPLVEKLVTEYCSHQFINFLISMSESCDLVETLKRTKELQIRAREFINGASKNSIPQARRANVKMEGPFMAKIEVKEEIKMEEEENIKTEEKPVVAKQAVIVQNQVTPVKMKAAKVFSKETTPRIFKKKAVKSYSKKGVVDHRKELFFEKFIKGAVISKFNSIKKEENSTAHVTPITNQRSKRTLNERMKVINSKKNSAMNSKSALRVLEYSKSKTNGKSKSKSIKRRKITTSFGNQLVYIKKRKSSKLKNRKKKTSTNNKNGQGKTREKKEDVLIDLKNATKEDIKDLSDCEFLDEKEAQELYKSPHKQKPAQILSKKISSDFKKLGTISESKIPNNELMSSSQKKNTVSKLNLENSSETIERKSSAKNSKNKVEVIDCESDNENFLTFEDWSKNIVAFSTPLKEKAVERKLIDVSQKELSFEGVGV